MQVRAVGITKSKEQAQQLPTKQLLHWKNTPEKIWNISLEIYMLS
jgi:hypothetical protein